MHMYGQSEDYAPSKPSRIKTKPTKNFNKCTKICFLPISPTVQLTSTRLPWPPQTPTGLALLAEI